MSTRVTCTGCAARFRTLSSSESDFNFDYNVSFTPDQLKKKQAFYNFTLQDRGLAESEGVSIFLKNPKGRIFHTYSTYARGIDMLSVDYQFLDLVPKGRDEGDRGPFWVRRHDVYEPARAAGRRARRASKG